MIETREGALQSAIDAIALAVDDDFSEPRDTDARRDARLSASGLAGRVRDRLLDVSATLLLVAVARTVGAAAQAVALFVPDSSRPTCPRCGARTTRVGEVTRELGGGLVHLEHLFYCPTCRTILQEDVVSHADVPHSA